MTAADLPGLIAEWNELAAVRDTERAWLSEHINCQWGPEKERHAKRDHAACGRLMDIASAIQAITGEHPCASGITRPGYQMSLDESA